MDSAILAIPSSTYAISNPNYVSSLLLSADDNGTINNLIVADQLSPDSDGLMFLRTVLTPAINQSGMIASSVSLYDTSGAGIDDEMIIRYDPTTNSLQPIVRKGDQAPGGGEFVGTAFQANQVFHNPYIANDGSVAFSAYLLNTSFGNAGIFIGDGSELTSVIRSGQPLPGGYTAGIIWGLDYSANGLVAFTMHTVGSTAQDAVYVSNGNSIQKILDPTDVAPNGQIFSGPSRVVKVSNDGYAAFQASLYPSGITGMYIGNDSELVQLALEGEAAPENHGTFYSLGFAAIDFSMSDQGMLAFEAKLTKNTPNDHMAIYLYDRTELKEIVSTFDQIDGSQIVSLDLAGRTDAQAEGVNDNGDVLFKFKLADGREGTAVWR